MIDAGRVSALRSQTIYHALAYARTGDTPDTVVLSTPETPYVCTGYHRSPGEEVDLNYCQANQLPVIRRETGGGTVYIDDRQMFVQWIFAPERLPRRVDARFRLFCQPLIETYQFFGIKAFFFPPNDVHVHNRKIVGTGAGAIGEAEVVTGNFIFDFDPQPMADLLHVPSEHFRQLALEGMKKYMSSFRRELKSIPDPEKVKQVYLDNCRGALDRRLVSGDFTGPELQRMAELDEQFARQAQETGSNPAASGLRRVKIHAGVWVNETRVPTQTGSFAITMRTKGERIDDIVFSGDTGIHPASRVRGLQKALTHVELNPDQLRDILDSWFKLHRVHSTQLSVDDWIDALLKCTV